MLITQKDQYGDTVVCGSGYINALKGAAPVNVIQAGKYQKANFLVTVKFLKTIDDKSKVERMHWETINCGVYRTRRAENMFNLARTLRRGEQILFVGSERSHLYATENGEKEYTEIAIDSFVLPDRLAQLLFNDPTVFEKKNRTFAADNEYEF